AKIKNLIFIGGGLQVGLATLATMAALALFGVDWRAGLFTGFLVSLSSTAIVLKLLGERGETNATHGQVGLGLLIFQDLAIIVMVLLVPMLGGSGGSGWDIAFALGKAVAIIAVVLLFARRLMPKVLEMVALTCSPELFLLAVIAICFGTAYLTSLAGVSLSLGAFLAGLLVSESRFSEHALGETMPLQILFSATFFVSVGMLLNVGFLISNPLLVVAAIAVVLVVKLVTTGMSVLALGYKFPTAVAAGLMLAQVGEFSFVLEREGRLAGLTPANLGEAGSQAFISATVVLMVITPFLMQLGGRISSSLGRRRTESDAARMEERGALPGDVPYMEDHVVVAGYGEAARRLVRVLSGSRIPYIITTLSPTGANEAEGEGLPVLRGDASKQHTLVLAGIERAKMMVIADDDPATAGRITAVARTMNPTMRIVVRTRYIVETRPLEEAGADHVILEELESIVQLFAEVLRDYRVPAEEIEAHEEAVRGGSYAALLGNPSQASKPVVICNPGQDCLDSRTVMVRAHAPIAQQTLGELALESNYGLSLLRLRRKGQVITDAPSDFQIQPGDELTLSGSTLAFAQSAPLFRQESASDESSPAGIEPSGVVRRASIDTERRVELGVDAAQTNCGHLGQIRSVLPSAPGCEECLRTGDAWVHLRICMTCGHVGCCDSSKNRHASKHYPQTNHPIIKSIEPGENWAWCFADEQYLEK
ncbi:MAG: cation:proton antiporter, partial [Pyrinomonadaceae bacterium]